MLPKRVRLFATIFLAGLLCIFAGVGFARIAQRGSEGQAPIKELRIEIAVNHQEELFVELQKFASKHGFEILIRNVKVIPEAIFVEMYRDDLKISALSLPDNPNKIDLNFYERNPAKPAPKATVDELFNDLKIFLNAIPNVKIAEQQ